MATKPKPPPVSNRPGAAVAGGPSKGGTYDEFGQPPWRMADAVCPAAIGALLSCREHRLLIM